MVVDVVIASCLARCVVEPSGVSHEQDAKCVEKSGGS